MAIKIKAWGVGSKKDCVVKESPDFDGIDFEYYNIAGELQRLRICEESIPALSDFVSEIAAKRTLESVLNALAHARTELELAKSPHETTVWRAKTEALAQVAVLCGAQF